KEGEASNGIARINNDSWVDLLQENTLNYSKVFKTKHRINALIGNTVQVNDFRTNQQYATNFSTNALGYNNISSASVFAPGSQFSNKTKWQIASFIGRLIYSFDDKYIFTATGRFDGNSKYGTQNKWGFFPSFGGAWRLSNEKFMRGIRLLNDMKIRVSWGELGNSKIEPYSSFTKLSPGITVGADGKPLNTLQNTDQLMGNPDLRWERQQQYNIGLDAVALNNRLRLSLDVYKKISKDLILRTPLPLTTGYSLIYSNVGELQNKGLEITLGGRVIDRSLKWDIDLNWSANRNKLTKLYGGLTERLNNANNPTAAGGGW
ncbi:MAG: TonB-dependent receptor, partial [Bacteroidales bacterium]|nr:TonB-dependent receptor [Bacteroidales bacterium]